VAFVPGTSIDKPSVDLTDVRQPFEKIWRVQRALRRAGCSETIVGNFKTAAVQGGLLNGIDQAVSDYVVISE